MVERLASRSGFEQRPRHIHHVRRTRAFVADGGPASCTKTSHGARFAIFVAGDIRESCRYAEAAPPTAHVSCIGGAMGVAAGNRMVVPSPAGRKIDLDAYPSANAFSQYRRAQTQAYLSRRDSFHTRSAPATIDRALSASFARRSARCAERFFLERRPRSRSVRWSPGKPGTKRPTRPASGGSRPCTRLGTHADRKVLPRVLRRCRASARAGHAQGY